MNTNEKVLKALTDSNAPLKAGDIAEKTGIDKKDVEKAIKALVTESKIFSPKRCFYDIKH
jgi:predicted transcriptional regulator